MKHHRPIFLFFIFLLDVAFINSLLIPRLSPFPQPEPETIFYKPKPLFSVDPEDVKTFYYDQLLDHFNYLPQSYTTFKQRYIINFKYWGGANSSAPILVYLGAEAPIDDCPTTVGFMGDNAAFFKALLVYIEHRYYGKSVPYSSNEEAYQNAYTLGYFNSAQAIADYAAILLHIKNSLQAPKSPVIVIGGSYGGMLATWFRLKYPHVATGALASSAPILYFDDITPQDAYFDIVTKDFKEASETCYQTIVNSWSEIDRVASQPDGLSVLSERFNTCSPLIQSHELVHYLQGIYAKAAQYNFPPKYPVTAICEGIDGAFFGNDTLSKIYGGVVAYQGHGSCKIIAFESKSEPFVKFQLTKALDGWTWQTCSEIVMPIGQGNHSMFPPKPFDFKSVAEWCKETFGVSPRPHWVTTYYGGQNINLVLQKFGSNIIFSNGLKDPYSGGGVLNSLSDSLIALHTVNGAHCLDLVPATPTDPEWLVKQRNKEVEIIQGWINQYYADLDAPKGVKIQGHMSATYPLFHSELRSASAKALMHHSNPYVMCNPSVNIGNQ